MTTSEKKPTRMRAAAEQVAALVCFLAPFALGSIWTGGEGL